MERDPLTDDLLVEMIKEIVLSSGGFWEGRVTPLYEAVRERVLARCRAPIDFPRTSTAFGWAFRRIGHDGFARAGLEWRRWAKTGHPRYSLNTFRVLPDCETKPGTAA
jgi:hypothetical protein